MNSVSEFSLTNNAGEVVKLQFVWWDASGHKHHEDGTGGIAINQTERRSPGQSGVPVGATVSLYVFVVWGVNVEASEQFTYDPNSSYTAAYSITGTTLDSHLHLLNAPVAAQG